MKVRPIVSLILCFALALGVALGQDYRATVQGVVTDSSGALVVGVQVTLLNVNTGIFAIQQSSDLGHYRFGFVEPGTYRVTVEMAGFSKSVRENILVQIRADVTVDLSLKPGMTSDSITVTASPVELQFNTSTKEITLDRKQLMELPIQARNPYSLALLDPAVMNTYPGEKTPFHMWAASQMDFGGHTSRENDVLIDGAPVQVGPKGSYTPSMDSVQEISVQQVSVDAEFGHSAGGILNLSSRAGTNEIHGGAYYFGRNPSFNAATNALTHTPSVVRNHIWGGTLGGPIRKNKLFSFATYEGWKSSSPSTVTMTLPTDPERNGDFSQSKNILGGERVIYNPFTTQYDPAAGVATRQPFNGNMIPASLLNSTSKTMLSDIWKPNNPGSNITGASNFRKTVAVMTDYWNFSDRTDWNVNDKLRVFGRYSRFSALNGLQDYSGMNSPAMSNGAGGLMASTNIAADAVYTIDATTVASIRFSYAGFQDNWASPQSKIGTSGLSKLWPNNAWYQPYLDQTGSNIYFPGLNIGNNSYGVNSYWLQEPHSYSLASKIAKSTGRHNYKLGLETRYQHAFVSYPNPMGFNFDAATTASTFINPVVNREGDAYAAFLLGAAGDSSYASYQSPTEVSIHYYGAYIQDDFKLSRNVSLNLGLRYEYESAPVDAQNRFTRFVDLKAANPTLQANPVQFPDSVTQLRAANGLSAVPAPNGNWVYANSDHRTPYNAPKFNLAPRAGVAIRLNDHTAFQAGWGRFLALSSMVQDGLLTSRQFTGYSVTTPILPSIQGVPQTPLSDPFPNNNPLQPVVGKSLGVNTNLGNGGSYRYQDYQDGTNDRFNFTLQRELPAKLKLDVTFYMNYGRNLDVTTTWDSFPANNWDPNLVYKTLQGNAYNTVTNPYYHYLTTAQFPGSLRNRPTLDLVELLRPLPQYGDLEVNNVPRAGDTTKSLELKLQRAYANGFSVLAAYMYYREQQTWIPNDLYSYNWTTAWTDAGSPRHRVSMAGTYDLPFGHGRPLLNNVNPVVNGVLGGWSFSPILTLTSGSYPTFWNAMVVTGDPNQNVPAGYAFNPNAFGPLPAFTPRTAPIFYAGVTGPMHWNVDASLSKSFPIRERLKLELRGEAYNLTNSIIWNNPDPGYGDSEFGQLHTGQANTGRTIQYTLRLSF